MSEFDMNLLIEELQERNDNLNEENNELSLKNQRLSNVLDKIKEIMDEDDSADNIYMKLRDYLEEIE